MQESLSINSSLGSTSFVAYGHEEDLRLPAQPFAHVLLWGIQTAILIHNSLNRTSSYGIRLESRLLKP